MIFEVIRWIRQVESVPEFAAIQAAAASEPGRALELAWTAYERTQAWGGPAAAYGQAVLGGQLAHVGRWEDALTHLLPAITELRKARHAEDVLTSALLDASFAHAGLNEPAASLPLVTEALTLTYRHGRHRLHLDAYHRGPRAIRSTSQRYAHSRNASECDETRCAHFRALPVSVREWRT
ncbi:hypothetical protein [Hamadaea tsunoensis]|uniref:hypothetical protein n=1 Tax=Hamadaea tsunoensis TaxID=53368 RepID=UPI0004174025|nr:hypothetical protein [Hamadaea tsunoensis]